MVRPRSFDENEVLHRTIRSFIARGYEATSVSDLETATGLRRVSLYNAFGDKERLLVCSLEAYARMAGDRFLAPLEQPDASLNTIEAVLTGMAGLAHTDEGRHGCLMCNTSREPIAESSSKVRQELDRYFARIEAAFGHAIGNALDETDADGTAAAGLAMFMTGVLVGVCTLAKAGARQELIDTFTRSSLDFLQVRIRNQRGTRHA